jgi:hypothetical protein
MHTTKLSICTRLECHEIFSTIFSAPLHGRVKINKLTKWCLTSVIYIQLISNWIRRFVSVTIKSWNWILPGPLQTNLHVMDTQFITSNICLILLRFPSKTIAFNSFFCHSCYLVCCTMLLTNIRCATSKHDRSLLLAFGKPMVRLLVMVHRTTVKPNWVAGTAEAVTYMYNIYLNMQNNVTWEILGLRSIRTPLCCNFGLRTARNSDRNPDIISYAFKFNFILIYITGARRFTLNQKWQA